MSCLQRSLLLISCIDYSRPNRIQFVLWNSEKYNMSWTSVAQDPTVAALKSKGSLSVKNRSLNAGQVDSTKGRMPRYIAPLASVTIPQQWNNSYTSFVNQINSKTWRVMGETIYIRNFSTIQVPALLIEVDANFVGSLVMPFSLLIFIFFNSFAVGKTGRERSSPRRLPVYSCVQC